MRFEERAAVPYGVPPTEFVAARDEQVREARTAGDAELAKRLKELRKPTQSAWLVNILWREHRDDVERLFDLGEEFAQAQSGESMRELFARRQLILRELVRAAARLAGRAGVQVSADAATEVEETLGAALADPDAAEEVRSGRLVKPLSYAGFGPPIPRPAAGPPTETKPPAKAPAGRRAAGRTAAKEAGVTRAPAKAEEAARRKALAAADKAVASAQKSADDAEAKARATEKELDEFTRQRDRIREQVRDAQRRLAEAELDVRSATADLKRANQAATEARRRLDKAERDRTALTESR